MGNGCQRRRRRGSDGGRSRRTTCNSAHHSGLFALEAHCQLGQAIGGHAEHGLRLSLSIHFGRLAKIGASLRRDSGALALQSAVQAVPGQPEGRLKLPAEFVLPRRWYAGTRTSSDRLRLLCSASRPWPPTAAAALDRDGAVLAMLVVSVAGLGPIFAGHKLNPRATPQRQWTPCPSSHTSVSRPPAGTAPALSAWPTTARHCARARGAVGCDRPPSAGARLGNGWLAWTTCNGRPRS